jgi:hypothetical protein
MHGMLSSRCIEAVCYACAATITYIFYCHSRHSIEMRANSCVAFD